MPSRSIPLFRRNQFWIFQLLGWSGWVLMLILRDLIFVPPEYIFPRALVFGASAVVGVLLTSGLRALFKLVWEQGLAVRFMITILGAFGAALIWQPFRNFIALLPFGETLDFANTSAENLLSGLFSNSFPVLLVWSGLYYIFSYYQLFQIEKEKGLRSEALAHQAQLLMLRYQLNPHFLFNTLNAISTLVLAKANSQANEMLIKLSKFLRYSLDHSPLDQVSLAHELESCRLYLDIEKVRFGDRLRLHYDIAADAQEALVPSMLLQPIVENSIKHAISKAANGGSIAISARRNNGRLVIEVADDGPGLSDADAPTEDASPSRGVGVRNIRNRLLEIYGQNHDLSFINREPNGLQVRVEIPYDTK